MTTLHIDFESFSACDLPNEGLDNYAKHPTTGIHCIAWAFDDGPVKCWPEVPAIELTEVHRHVAAGGIVYAHNAAFELAIWNNVCVPKYGWPVLKPEQCRCTMAMAYAMALPDSLEKAAAALGLEMQKDIAGSRVMMQLAKPKEDGSFWKPDDAPDKFAKLYAYCKQDVVVERELTKRLMPLSEQEQRIWELDFAINQKGIQVDLPSIERAIALVEAEKKRLDGEMLRVTGGEVGKCSEVQLLVKWIRSQGVEISGVAKAELLDALSGELPPLVERALRLRQEAAKSSTAKLIAMKRLAGPDGRVRNGYQYHGAGTGRWAHRGVQTGNMIRPRVHSKDDDEQAKHIATITQMLVDQRYAELNMFYGPLMDAVADGLRGMITAAPGKTLIAADFSAIEARVLAWLAGQEEVLDIFRTHAKIYEHAAAGIYRKDIADVTKAERQVGKVAVLALGYQGGIGAFQSMARIYGVRVEDSQADGIKVAWREAHPKIVRYWYALENAAIDAVRNGGVVRAGAAGREVAFKKSGSFLWCRLPSGRCLCYPYPWMDTTVTVERLQKGVVKTRKISRKRHQAEGLKPGERFLEETSKESLWYLTVNGVTKKWEETPTYGGHLAENVTQAVARDLLAEAMVRLDSRGYDVTMHVHDEVVVEVPTPCDDNKVREVESIMSEVPAWADGLPLAAEGWVNFRYKK